MSELILPPPFDPYAYAESLEPVVLVMFEPLHTRGVYLRTSQGHGIHGRICISRRLGDLEAREITTHELGHHHTSASVALKFGAAETVALLSSSLWSPDHDEKVLAYFACDEEADDLAARREEAMANKWAREHLFPPSVLEAVKAWREEKGLGFGDGDDWLWLESLLQVSAATLRKWAQVYEATGQVRGSNWHRPEKSEM